MSIYYLLKYSSNYSDTIGSLRFYSKGEVIYLNNHIADTNHFKSFTYNAKLLENTEADTANGTLRNTKIALPLKYLSNFLISLEMSLTNCEVELKLIRPKYYVLATTGADNTEASPDNIFTIKDTKLYVPAITLSAKGNPKLSKVLSNGFERSVYLNEYKAKSENKNKENEYR